MSDPRDYIRDQIKQGLHEFYTDEEAEQWLKSPHLAGLLGKTPDQLIEEGRWEDVWALIEQLKTGAHV